MEAIRSGLFSRRKRLADIEQRELSGASFWTSEFDTSVRNRIWHLFRRAVPNQLDSALYIYGGTARLLILEDEGLLTLCGESDSLRDFVRWAAQDCPHDDYPTVIEAMMQALMQEVSNGITYRSHQGDFPLFHREICSILREHRISYDFHTARMVPLSSQVLHTSVVVPALTLLAEGPRFAAAEQAYREALDELSQGNARDAITDAATALQQMLAALGNTGGTLPDLLKSARKRQMLLGHDHILIESIEKAIQWVAVDRSELGDVHNVGDANLGDAWLIVHIAGALIVRLAKNEPRKK